MSEKYEETSGYTITPKNLLLDSPFLNHPDSEQNTLKFSSFIHFPLDSELMFCAGLQ